MAQFAGMDATGKNHICVAVRFRPLSDREINRGDREVWKCVDNAVGVQEDDVGMNVKFVYDHVFHGAVGNTEVYNTVASSIVQSAMDGINGTVFAYGVTSSGKTHTMMGDDVSPGIVPHAIAEVYHLVAKYTKKEYLLRISMLEIYNEVVHDLLEPSNNASLRLREDARRGVYVENVKEERLMSADHALMVVATGNENRKTSATAFNEGSSRSHTVIRLTIEANDRPEFASDPDARLGRTFSFLTLVDLAGSESAKAEINRNQRMEGSFINKSLLTLGTVIHKLSEGGAAHIPFRDSKLTRILSNSLTGNGARVAVICTITPASTQAEETHNTLKFASRAKKIAIEAKRNEIMDQSSLIARYQQEISLLRHQLAMVMRERGEGALPVHDPMHPEVRTLRERLEEEHMAVVKTEKENGRLVSRVDRLTQCILHSTATLSHMERRLSGRPAGPATPPGEEATQRRMGPEADVAAAVMAVRSAGELIPGEKALRMSAVRRVDEAQVVEADLLRKQVITLAEEVRERERSMRALVAVGGGGDEVENDVTMQVMLAEREYMQSQVEDYKSHNGELALALERMRRMLATARRVEPDSIDLEAIIAGDVDAAGEGADVPVQELEEAARPLRRGYDHVLADKVLKMEEKVSMAIDALRQKEEDLANKREVLRTLTGIENQGQNKIADLKFENDNLRRELQRVEARNEVLQGHSVDKLTHAELTELIDSLTAAVNRVRLTVQLKKIAVRDNSSGSKIRVTSPETRARAAGMSMQDMEEALEQLKARGAAKG